MNFAGGDPDAAIRLRAFAELGRLTAIHGPVLRWEELAPGFLLSNGDRALFANRARGIFRPAQMAGGALSVKTTVPREGRVARYEDRGHGDGSFHYDMQGDDPSNADNRLLERAWRHQLPLIYFAGVKAGMYRPIWPVFVTGFHPETLSVTIQADDVDVMRSVPAAADSVAEKVRRQYATILAKRRVHQAVFRENVLAAYAERCAICRMPRRELLDAAHIIPDSEPEGGDPVVPNGLSLCKLHHAAFDADLLGVTPTNMIVLSKRLLATRDGPTLEHGLKDFHRKSLYLPKDEKSRPDPDRLRRRFDRFEISAGAA